MMPHRLWSLHMRILRLPDHEHAAIVVWYVGAIHVEQPRVFVVYPIEVQIDDSDCETEIPNARLIGIRYCIHQRGGNQVGPPDGYCSHEVATLRASAMTRGDARLYGSPWTTEQKAERLEITADALYKRLHRAKQRLLGLLPLFGDNQ